MSFATILPDNCSRQHFLYIFFSNIFIFFSENKTFQVNCLLGSCFTQNPKPFQKNDKKYFRMPYIVVVTGTLRVNDVLKFWSERFKNVIQKEV